MLGMEVKVQGNAWLPGKAAGGGGRLLAEARTASAGEQCDLLTSCLWGLRGGVTHDQIHF